MKKILFNFFLCFIVNTVSGQNPNSFYLDSMINASSSRVAFSADAIYLYNNVSLTKANYQGIVIWQRENPFDKLIVVDNFIFGIHSDSLVKMDTSGIVLWIKKFSTPICNAISFSNVFSEIVYDGTHLILQELQEPNYGTATSVHPVVIVADTSGNIISTRCDSLYVGTNPWFFLAAGCASLRGGAIFSYEYQGGNYYYAFSERENSNGALDQSASFPVFHTAAMDFIWQLIPTIDSAYLILSNAEFYQPQFDVAALFTITKVAENGSVFWTTTPSDMATIPNGDFKVAAGLGIAIDSSNNIYVVGQANISAGYNGFFATKLNSAGNVLFTNFWNESNPIKFTLPATYPTHDFHNMIYFSNGNLFCLAQYEVSGNNCKPAIIVFDTLLNNACNMPDSTLQFVNYSTFIDSILLPRFSNNVSPVYVNDSVSTNILNVASKDLCLALGDKYPPSRKNILSIFPNPTTGNFTIKDISPNEKTLIEVTNVFGETVYVEKLFGKNEYLIDANFAKGIYLVRVRDVVRKLIVD